MPARMTKLNTSIFVHDDTKINMHDSGSGGFTINFEREETREEVDIFIFREAFDSFINAIAKNERVYNALMVAVAKLGQSDNQPVNG